MTQAVLVDVEQAVEEENHLKQKKKQIIQTAVIKKTQSQYIIQVMNLVR